MNNFYHIYSPDLDWIGDCPSVIINRRSPQLVRAIGWLKLHGRCRWTYCPFLVYTFYIENRKIAMTFKLFFMRVESMGQKETAVRIFHSPSMKVLQWENGSYSCNRWIHSDLLYHVYLRCLEDIEVHGTPTTVIRYLGINYPSMVVWADRQFTHYHRVLEHHGVWCIFWNNSDAVRCKLTWSERF
jgi:hypothetical protein